MVGQHGIQLGAGGLRPWVKNHIDARNKKVTVTYNLMIDMDPEVAAAFAASTAVSVESID